MAHLSQAITSEELAHMVFHQESERTRCDTKKKYCYVNTVKAIPTPISAI